jgi:hypothetical protein
LGGAGVTQRVRQSDVTSRRTNEPRPCSTRSDAMFSDPSGRHNQDAPETSLMRNRSGLLPTLYLDQLAVILPADDAV